MHMQITSSASLNARQPLLLRYQLRRSLHTAARLCKQRGLPLPAEPKGKSDSASKAKGKTAAEIIAQDQVGPEFDPLANSEQSIDQDGRDSKGSPQADSENIQDVVTEDQSGQEFEPLKAKRIVGKP